MLRIPYVGRASVAFSKEMSRLMKQNYQQEIKTVYETTKVKDYFGLKDTTPKEIRSRVVYKFICSSDSNIVYIGYTNRTLRERVKEHFGGSKTSAIADHIMSCRNCEEKASLDSFTILKQCQNKYDTMVYEALYIKTENPTLRQLVKPGQTFTLRVFD